jgi:CheY-like chemotaxis protein
MAESGPGPGGEVPTGPVPGKGIYPTGLANDARGNQGPSAMTPSAPSRGTVLIADDEPEARRPVAELLRRVGFVVVEAESGAEVLQRLQAAPVDALVMDIHMPGNAGLETTSQVRRLVPALPILLLTGQPSVATAQRAVRLPVTAYLTKPPAVEELALLLDEGIAAHRRAQALATGRERLRAWDAEIGRIEAALAGADTADSGGAFRSYLALTLRQVILTLADLEAAVDLAHRGGGTDVERTAALRETVRVLERTKQNFKSRELAELRKKLQGFLAEGD